MTWAMQRKKKEFCSFFLGGGGGYRCLNIYIERENIHSQKWGLNSLGARDLLKRFRIVSATPQIMHKLQFIYQLRLI